MPWAAVAAIAALATAGATIGNTVYQDLNVPDPNAALKAQEQNQLLTADQQRAAQQKTAAQVIAQGAPNEQANTSGATTPDYIASVEGTKAGIPGSPNVDLAAIGKWLGSGSGGAESPSNPTNFFPSAAVPSFSEFLPSGSGTDSSSGLSGGSQ